VASNAYALQVLRNGLRRLEIEEDIYKNLRYWTWRQGVIRYVTWKHCYDVRLCNDTMSIDNPRDEEYIPFSFSADQWAYGGKWLKLAHKRKYREWDVVEVKLNKGM